MLGAGVSPSAGYSEQRAVKLQVETIVDGKAEDQMVTSIPFALFLQSALKMSACRFAIMC